MRLGTGDGGGTRWLVDVKCPNSLSAEEREDKKSKRSKDLERGCAINRSMRELQVCCLVARLDVGSLEPKELMN